MPEIVVTNECHELVRSKAISKFRPGSRRLYDGSWVITLDIEVIQRIESYAIPGETLSDTIIRVLSGKPN